MWRVKLKERKKIEELGEQLGLESVSLMIKKSKLRRFGPVEHKGNADCMKLEAEVITCSQSVHPKKTWWDYLKDDMESLGPSQKYEQFRNKCRRKENYGANWLIQVHLENGH